MISKIITKEELIRRLQDIEWEDFEVKEAKSAVPKSSWETVSAFANTAGGWLIFGVKETGKKFVIQGVKNSEKIANDFLTTLRGNKFNKKTIVKSNRYKIDGETVLGFYIPSVSAKDKPVYFNALTNTFIRTGSGDQRATQEEIDSLYRNSSFDKKDEELTEFTIKDLNNDTIKRYRVYLKNVDPEHRYNKLSTEKLLEKLRVLAKGKVTIGGLLVFGKEDSIGILLSDFRIDYLEIMGTSYSDAPARYQYRLSEEENLFSFYFSIFERLIKKIEIPFKQKGKWALRDENQPQVKAIKEALVNLLMHADYFSNAKPRIRAFLDRIEFFNPGALPKDVKYIIKEDFSMPRNPVVARIFRIIKLAENIGSGFDKMIKGWRAHYKKTPEISGDFDYYKIVFPFNDKDTKKATRKAKEKLGVKLGVNEEKILIEGLNDRQREATEYIKKQGSMANKEYRNIFKVSAATAKRELRDLLKKNVCKTKGAGPSLKYIIG